MIKVLSQAATGLLSPEHRYEWVDLTGKEVQIAETEKDGVYKIALELKPQGTRKTSTILLTIATIAVAAAVSEKYAEDALLQPTIKTFVANQLTERLGQIGRYIDSSMNRSRGVVDMTNLQPIDIKIAERVERDDADAVVSTDITAEVESGVYVYSSVGIFDIQAV